MPDLRRLTWFVSVIGFTCLTTPIAHALQLNKAELANRRCYACHGQSHIADLSPTERRLMIIPNATDLAGEPETRPELYLPPDALKASPHSKLACVSCHTTAKQLPHPQKLGPATCDNSCHTAESAAYRRSEHAKARADHNARAPTCASCHGGHNILPPTDRRSKVYPLNVIKTCAGCHAKFTMLTSIGVNSKQIVSNYLESVHGKAIQQGLVVAATCADCHRPHDIEPASSANSSINRAHISDTCGRCHVGVTEIYAKSIFVRNTDEWLIYAGKNKQNNDTANQSIRIIRFIDGRPDVEWNCSTATIRPILDSMLVEPTVTINLVKPTVTILASSVKTKRQKASFPRLHATQPIAAPIRNLPVADLVKLARQFGDDKIVQPSGHFAEIMLQLQRRKALGARGIVRPFGVLPVYLCLGLPCDFS